MAVSRSLPPIVCALCAALATPAAAGVEQLADAYRAETPAEALAVVDGLAASPGAREMGIDYLRGDLLESMGHTAEAVRAFSLAMQRSPALAPYCRLRLARIQVTRHPEMAAGLLAPLLDEPGPPTLRHQAAELLGRALRSGGDCRLLASLDWSAVDPADRRALAVARADCEEPAGARPASAKTGNDRRVAELAKLLDNDAGDTASWDAALRLSTVARAELPADVALELARTFQQLRQPELASAILGPLVSTLPTQLREPRHVEAFELLALSQVGRDAYRSAVGTYARLAERVSRADQRAHAYHQEGWARELAGDRLGALQAYVRAANLSAGPTSTSAALLAALRLQWLLGRRSEAQQTYDILRSRREWSEVAAEAALFLAVSQLAAGDVGSAPALLQQAVQLRGRADTETVYWIARADEAQRKPSAALAQYLAILRERPYHPLAAEARRRLAAPAMAGAVKNAVERWRRSTRVEDRVAAWTVLPPDDPRREALRLSLYQTWARDRHLAPFLRLAAVDPREWPLWKAATDAPEDRVLALGGWREVSLETILRHFPLSDPDLALTAAQRLLSAHDPARALAVAQQSTASALAAAPPQLLPVPLREVLFPHPWRERVVAAAHRQGIDPALLFGLMREGSAFDPGATTTWGGRGLLLVDPRSAERAAPQAGLPRVRPDDLFEPDIGIAVGAARLAQLGAASGSLPLVLAAHFGGTSQARLWASWCVGDDPAEQLVKIGSPEVRVTIERVLGAQMAYRELGDRP